MLSSLDPDPDWFVRNALAEALGRLPEGQGVARLQTMLTDRDPRVVASVLRALVAAKAPGMDRILLDRVRAFDVVSRLAAIELLADLKATAAVATLTEAYRSATGGDGYVMRTALLNALNAIDPASARPLAQEALHDPEWALRLKASALLRAQGVSDSSAEIRPAPVLPIGDAQWGALITPQFSPHAYIDTDKGTIEIEMAILDAPLTVSNFVRLARIGFFDGLPMHRVVPDFVIQGGDPHGDGEGGPGYSIRDELNELPYLRGMVGMALDGKDTGGSQFFITHSPQPHLDARYTAFGRVVSGMDVVDRIQPWDVIRRVRIWDGTTPP
jgi:cyclophilin family peptidyl-prolyl cis-trans isomerase